MQDVFNNDSWNIVYGQVNNNLIVGESRKNKENVKSHAKLEYLKPIYFNENCDIYLEINGNIIFIVNGEEYHIRNNKIENHKISISNNKLEHNNNKINIPVNDFDKLNLIISNNTVVNSFLIVQDVNINNCNPEFN